MGIYGGVGLVPRGLECRAGGFLTWGCPETASGN